MSDVSESQAAPSVTAVLCVEAEAFDRFGRVLRHLLVGLVDQAVNVRLASTDPRVEQLTLGPIQTVVYQRMVWPIAPRRVTALLDALSQRPPTLVHAMSGASYTAAGAVAEAFDADLVLQVTSLSDCDAVAEFAGPPVGRYIAFSQPLVAALEDRLKIPPDRIELIRPGVRTSEQPACFARPGQIPSMLCAAPLEPGLGADRLIEAADLLRRRNHTFMLFLLGTGSQESILRRMIRQRGLLPHVTLAHLVEGVAQAMHHADIFVRPSAETAFTDDSLQAMGAGLAVVTCPGPIADHFRAGETAVLCTRCDAGSLATAIEGLLVDPARAQRLAASAVAYVRTHHTVSAMAERAAETYRQLALARATFPIKE